MRSLAVIACLALALAATASAAQESLPDQPSQAAPAPQTGMLASDPAPVVPAPEAADAQNAVAPDAGSTTEAEAIPTTLLPHNLSPWGMFMNADIIVKAVMIGLAFASLVTWTVWLAKSLELLAARTRAWRGAHVIVQARSLDQAAKMLGSGSNAASLLVQAASQEVELSSKALDHCGGDGLKERVASRLSRIEAQAARRMTRGTGLLATIGSTAPFVGLFGTVWGIMNAFIGISQAQTTNLAVVAPGIAEALLATALGLVAAIPAVVIYNVFARAIAGYRQVLADASAGVERLVSRDLDYRATPARALAAE